jgi:hypothetical protein
MTEDFTREELEKMLEKMKRPRKNPPPSLVGAKLPKHPPKKPAPPQKAPLPEDKP